MQHDRQHLTRRELIGRGLALGAAAVILRSSAGAQNAAPEAVDLLISGPDIVTYDDAGTVISDGAIAIRGSSIVWVGKASDAAKLYTPKDTLNASGLIAMPGLTDTHYHTAQQFLRGVRKVTHRRGPRWKNFLIPFESGLEPEDIYHSGIVGYTSMISAGTTPPAFWKPVVLTRTKWAARRTRSGSVGGSPKIPVTWTKICLLRTCGRRTESSRKAKLS